MKTPIFDFLKEYENKKTSRLHMPGHKGNSCLGVEELDITEVPGADVLYNASGIIAESEKCAAKLFGTGKTLYSTEGSSLSIRAAVYLLSLYAKEKGKLPKILAARNAHKSFVSAAALCDVGVSWISGGEDSLFSCEIELSRLSERIKSEKPQAVYITSPDYLGNCADIEAISKICHDEGVCLLVDNAHGAYLNFLEKSRHPIELGADIACDSAHKTLPVLTGGAYLHISKSAPKLFSKEAERAMSLFASTSPSYLVLASLDLANKSLSDGLPERIKKTAKKVSELKARLSESGYVLFGDEPLKVTLFAKPYGYTGEEIAEYLFEKNITVEAADSDFVVMMFSADTKEKDFEKVKSALASLEKKAEIKTAHPKIPGDAPKMSIRDALFSSCEVIKASAGAGRIFCDCALSCPPAIPIAIAGEEIGDAHIKCFEYYGIDTVRVVKKSTSREF